MKMLQNRTLVLSSICLLISGNLSAAIYTSPTSQTPFDVTLDTGTSSWVVNNVNLQSSDTTNTHPHSNSSTSSVVVVEETPAGVGVAGSVDVYQDTTTTTNTYDHTANNQTATVNYDANLASQTTPGSYVLSGTITKQAGEILYDNNAWINFGMGLTVADGGTSLSGLSGMLTFEVGSNPDAYAYSYSTEFTGLVDSISFGDSNGLLDLNDPIFFTATYDITSLSGSDPFDITGLYLDLNANADSYFYDNYDTTSNTTRTLLSSTELPPLAPVPLPAATWLMFSGLLGLTAVARRKVRS